jgi:hypothetical protein
MSQRLLGVVSFSVFLLACGHTSGNDGGQGGGLGGGIGGGNAVGGGTGTGGGMQITDDAACTMSAQARCMQQQSCTPNSLQIDYGDLTTCEARIKASCLASLAASGTGNTAEGVAACANAYGTWSCSDWVNGFPPAACAPAQGVLTPGIACAFNGQCVTSWCAVARGASCGACATAPGVGSPCGGGVGCGTQAGLYCETNGNTCQQLVTDAGLFCDAGSCGYGLGCVIPTGSSNGTCQTLGDTVDAGCDALQHTAAACRKDLGLACVKKHCTQDPVASAGQPCGLDLDAGVVIECTASGTCYNPDGGAGGTCVAAKAEGMSCDTANGSVCFLPARCVSTDGGATDGGPVVGTCQLPSGTLCE